jgi:membrane-bound metal-dependent hydrolase YbcI (DUF457 family)
VATPVLGLPPGKAADPVVALALNVTAVALAALAPDVDHAGATLSRAAGGPGRAAARGVQAVLGHRGPLHSAPAALLAGVLAEVLGRRLGVTGLGLLVGCGWATHVLAHTLTDRGGPVLYPLWRQRVKLPRELGPATGGTGEAAVVAAGLLACGEWIALGFVA